MLSLLVRLRLRAGVEEEFLEAMTLNANSSLNDEPGCLQFDIACVSEGDSDYLLYEVYRDEAAFDEHRRTPHFARWRERAEHLVADGGQVNTFASIVHRPTETSATTSANGDQPLILRRHDITPFDRGSGVVTLPFVGKWACHSNRVTTGMTVFRPGTGIPLHTHNVEESVLVFEGSATATIGEHEYELGTGDATWVPAAIAHRFENRSTERMTIYWSYGGHQVTRTICATGETFEHLSAADRGATSSD